MSRSILQSLYAVVANRAPLRQGKRGRPEPTEQKVMKMRIESLTVLFRSWITLESHVTEEEAGNGVPMTIWRLVKMNEAREGAGRWGQDPARFEGI